MTRSSSPIAIAATSPYLAGRDAVYIIAGLAGIAALALLLLPLVDRAAADNRWRRWAAVFLAVAWLAFTLTASRGLS